MRKVFLIISVLLFFAHLHGQTIITVTKPTKTTVITSGQGGGGGAPDTEIEGFGADVTGGQGQTVKHVTNLNGSGAGSLENALTSNSYIVFDVGGTINERLEVTGLSNVTIDGTTAPDPGIIINNNNNGNGLSFDACSNIIVKGITVKNAGNDCLNFINTNGFVVDHCAFYGATDGCLDMTEGSQNGSVQWCIIGNGLVGSWSGCMLIAYEPTQKISVHHNLFSSLTDLGGSSVGERIPFVHYNGASKPSYPVVDFRNNLVWRWGRQGGTGSGYATAIAYNATGNVVNNYYYGGDPNYDENAINTDDGYGAGATGSVYASGNVSGDGISSTINSVSNEDEYTIAAQYQVAMQAACAAASYVLQYAGPPYKDATVQGYIDDVTPLYQCSIKYKPVFIEQYQPVIAANVLNQAYPSFETSMAIRRELSISIKKKAA